MDRLYISIGIIILSLLGIHVNKQMKKQQTEHFAGVISQLPKLFKAIISFFTNFVDLFMVLVDAIVNFALSFVDIIMVLVDALLDRKYSRMGSNIILKYSKYFYRYFNIYSPMA